MRQLLHNLTLIDVRGGRHARGAALLIEGGTIVATGRAADFGQDARATAHDLAGGYVVPGFVDPHAHLAFSTEPDAIDRVGDEQEAGSWQIALRSADAALQCGVTTLADCGGPGLLPLRLKRAVANGTVAGPRLLVSLAPITTPDGHCHHFGVHARGVHQVADATRRLVEQGADFIKVMASGGGTSGATGPTVRQYDAAELRAIVDVAHATGRKVAAHCRAATSIEAAVAAGVDRIEHLTWEAPGGIAYDPRIAADMAASSIWADPTLPAGRRAMRSDRIPAERREQLRLAFRARDPQYRRMAREVGIRLLSGTDAGTPLVRFDDFAFGPELLVSVAGYTPADALRAATLWGAAALGLAASRGTLEAGKLADLVVLRDDPLADASALRSPLGIMLGGRWVRGWPGPGGEAAR